MKGPDRLLAAATLLALLLSAEVRAEPAEWSFAGNLLSPTCYGRGVNMGDKALVVTGDRAETWDLLSRERITSMPLARPYLSPGMAALPDGSVLVVGANSQGDTSGEFLPAGGTKFEPTQKPPLSGLAMAAATTGSGDVLVAGGFIPGSGEVSGTASNQAALFRAQTRTWDLPGNLFQARARHAVIGLEDGRVAILGGWTGSQDSAEPALMVELYDPATDKITAAGYLNHPHVSPGVVSLGQGRLLVAGPNVIEVFDVGTGNSEVLPATPTLRNNTLAVQVPGPRAVLLGSGEAVELLEPSDGSLSALATLDLWVDEAAVLPGPGGTVWVFGGSYWEGNQTECRSEVQVLETGLGNGSGESCESALECLSGYCVSGICCQDPCLSINQCMSPSCAGGQCRMDPLPASSSCDDGDPCTRDDRCETAGMCRGTSYECEVRACTVESSCNGDGTCTLITAPEGEACDDGDPCTGEGVCKSGECVASPNGQCGEPDLTELPEPSCPQQEEVDVIPCGAGSSGGCSQGRQTMPGALLLPMSLVLLLAALRKRIQGGLQQPHFQPGEASGPARGERPTPLQEDTQAGCGR